MDKLKKLFERKNRPEIEVMPTPARRDSGSEEKNIVVAKSQYDLPVEQRTQWEAIVNKNVALLQKFADDAAKKKESDAGEWNIVQNDQMTSAYFPKSSDSIQLQFNEKTGEIIRIQFSNRPPQISLAGETGSQMFTRGVFDTRFAIAYIGSIDKGNQFKMISMENFEFLQADPDAIAVLGRSLENFRIQQGLNQ